MSVPLQHVFQEDQPDNPDWYRRLQACSRYFVDHAQHGALVQRVAALINVKLPYQKTNIASTTTTSGVTVILGPWSLSAGRRTETITDPSGTLLLPYIRRLVATSFDSPLILRSFFGDDWQEGIGYMHENERRNYLLAAKSDTWLAVKARYDMDDGQLVPYLRPLQGTCLSEIEAAETDWSNWLAMQDWMLGPRAPWGAF